MSSSLGSSGAPVAAGDAKSPSKDELRELTGGLERLKVGALADHHAYSVAREIDYGERAPDSGISVMKVAKEFLGGVKNGADVTNVNLPASVLDPMSSLEKGAKSMQRGELLVDIVEAASPEERFLQVLRYQLSGLPKERFGKKPYNPVLGEVFRAAFKHANTEKHGVTLLLAEQVSHHPPITALHVHNHSLGFAMTSHMKPEPKFWGNSIEVKLTGSIRIALDKFGETYELTRPTFWTTGILNIGKQRQEFIGETKLVCAASDLESTLEFKAKGLLGIRGEANAVAGKIKRRSTGEKLFEISGAWDKEVRVKDLRTKKERVLFDYEKVKAEKSMGMWVPPAAEMEPHNSLKVWEKCSEAIWAVDTTAANEEKKRVEEEQRRLRKQRQELGIDWTPAMFTRKDLGEGEFVYDFREDLEKMFTAS
mmetsp:Transcript_9228/g.24371  ORF Transcript_9228/g.24371 Transcript_9228/m.24371 type:complete len:424 (-) Transcript_9228:1104-2375(-)